MGGRVGGPPSWFRSSIHSGLESRVLVNFRSYPRSYFLPLHLSGVGRVGTGGGKWKNRVFSPKKTYWVPESRCGETDYRAAYSGNNIPLSQMPWVFRAVVPARGETGGVRPCSCGVVVSGSRCEEEGGRGRANSKESWTPRPGGVSLGLWTSLCDRGGRLRGFSHYNNPRGGFRRYKEKWVRYRYTTRASGINGPPSRPLPHDLWSPGPDRRSSPLVVSTPPLRELSQPRYRLGVNRLPPRDSSTQPIPRPPPPRGPLIQCNQRPHPPRGPPTQPTPRHTPPRGPPTQPHHDLPHHKQPPSYQSGYVERTGTGSGRTDTGR